MNIKENIKDLKDIHKEIFELIVLEQKWFLMPLAFMGYLLFLFTFGVILSLFVLFDEEDSLEKERNELFDSYFSEISKKNK